MRISGKHENISYTNTHMFFENRARKFSYVNPYSVTMYQDNNPELVKNRNKVEVEKLIPYLKLNVDSVVLDVACGIGRWSDAIKEDIKQYIGIDFCEQFVFLAKERSKKENRIFYTSSSVKIEECLMSNGHSGINRTLIIGALMYLNDEDVLKTLSQIEKLCDKNSIVCIREPIGIDKRLTLKEQFSEELQDEYNAIYRTRDELFDLIDRCLVLKGFSVVKEDYLFDNALNNRKETAQYYFILER